MKRNVDEINISRLSRTGSNAPFPQYEFDIEVVWTDDTGRKQRSSTRTYTFPDDLRSMPVKAQQNLIQDLIMKHVRVSLGIDTWKDYE
jgi:hypothetical protein